VKRSDAKKLSERKSKLASRLERGGELVDGTYMVDYEVSGRVVGTSYGGVAALLELARATSLDKAIDASVSVLSDHRPYKESDHILAMVASVLAGGQCPEDMRRLRQDAAFLDSLGMERFPDSTTAGDFLRRFQREDIEGLMGGVLAMTEETLRARLSAKERRLGLIEGDGTTAATDAECMEGIEYSGYKRQWGYAPLLISLANTGQPLFIVNRPGNAGSAQGAAEYFDRACESMLRVFDRVLLRGDTDFSQCNHLDRWNESGRIDFVFGFDACPALVARAQALAESAWCELVRPVRYEVKTTERQKPEHIKEQLIAGHCFKTLKTMHEDVAEFTYRPGACRSDYRIVALRKKIQVTAGQLELEPQTRYFFYITNLWTEPAAKIVQFANKRCNQENLIAQLAGQVHALSPASNTLLSNWAWMVIASLAWTLKSWFALMMAEPAERKRVAAMEFRSFCTRFIAIPVQIVRTARRIILRILGGHLPSIEPFLTTWADIRRLRRIRI
jgi:hypothetical protein